MERKWRENEEMEREWGNGKRFTLYISSLSFHFQIKDCLILSQNVKYGTFVANVTKNLTYVLWGNISGSNLRQESSASCEGLGYFVTNLRTFWCPFTGLWGMPMTYYVILKFFSPGAATVQAALEFMTPGGSLSPFKIASSFLFSIAFISTVFKTFL